MNKLTIFSFLIILASCTSKKYSQMTYTDARQYINTLEDRSWFYDTYNTYKPDENVLSAWENKNRLRILVFAGEWCSDTRFLLPRFYKAYDGVSGEKPITDIIWVNRDKKSRTGIEKKYKISNVPTFIVLEGDEEKGRVVENAQVSIEKDLADIMNK